MRNFGIYEMGWIRKGAAGVMAVLLAGLVHADGLDSKVEVGLNAIRAEKWVEAVGVFEKVGSKLKVDEPRRGVVSYHLGFCRLKLAIEAELGGDEGKSAEFLEKAAKDFGRCAEIGGQGQAVNIYQRRALLQLGVVLQKQGKYALALERYDEFLLKRDQLRDVYDRRVLLVNMAVCQSLKEEVDFVKAGALFLSAASGKMGEDLSGRDYLRGFAAVMEGGLEAAETEVVENWLKELKATESVKFVRGVEWGNLLLRLAYRFGEESKWGVGLALLEWVPSDEDFRQGVSKEVVAGYERMVKSEGTFQVRILSAKASILEQGGDFVGAYEVLHKLVTLLKDREALERNVYQMVRVAGLAGKPTLVLMAAKEYFERFEKGRYVDEVRALQMGAYREAGDFEHLAEAAEAMSKDGVEGASTYLLEAYYFGGEYEKALKLSQEVLAGAGSEQAKRDAVFFKGASQARMQFWKEAGEALDRYLGGESDLGYLNLARYERAEVFRETGELDEAAELLNGVIRDEKDSLIRGYALNLLGNIQQARRSRDEAERSYVQALELAREGHHSELEQESLFYLIEMLGQEYVGGSIQSELGRVLPYVDAFLERYSDSKYAAQVMVAAYPAMKEAGRVEEYLKVIEPILARFAEKDRTPGLDLAVNSYARALQANGLSLAEVRQKMLGDGRSRRLSAVMRDGLASIYRTFAENAWGASKVSKGLSYESRLVSVYAGLCAGWSPEEMPPYVALRVGGYLGDRDGERAKTYFEAARVRGTLAERLEANLGLGRLLVDEGKDLPRAEALLREVIVRDGYAGSEREEAFLVLGHLLKRSEQWKALVDLSQMYLSEENVGVSYRAEMTYLLAFAYYRSGKEDDAIVVYGRIYASYLNQLGVSALAVRDLTELTWARNSNRALGAKADRQVAYRLAQRYITMTRDTFRDRRSGLAAEAVEAWLAVERNVSLWEKSGEVKSVEDLLEDKRRGRESF